MQKSKKRLFDTNNSIAHTSENALREWQDEDYEDWCEYIQKFYEEMEKN